MRYTKTKNTSSVGKYVVIFVEYAKDILILVVKLGAKRAHIPEAR